jgi:hypothetical protein
MAEFKRQGHYYASSASTTAVKGDVAEAGYARSARPSRWFCRCIETGRRDETARFGALMFFGGGQQEC